MSRRPGASSEPAKTTQDTGLGSGLAPLRAVDPFEREADLAAQAFLRGAATQVSLGAPSSIQRKCAECEEEDKEDIRREPVDPVAAEPVAQSEPDAPDAQAADTPEAAAGPAVSWVVDDDSPAQPNQMRKSAFLNALRPAICATADEGMAGTGQTSKGCPWIAGWFDYYFDKDAAHINSAIRKFAPQSGTASSPAEVIPILAARVRRSVDQWALSGEVSGLPDDVPMDVPGADIFFKREPKHDAPSKSPQAVTSRLGAGAPMSAPLRSTMENAFGLSFARVRVHNDTQAASIADSLNARAFAVGEHVAFGAGEYDPQTPAGQALVAHELAHVAQQGAAAVPEAQRRSTTETESIEQDADHAAGEAMASVLTGERGIAGKVLPAIESGLSLQRCSKDKPPNKTPELPPTKEALGGHAGTCMLEANTGQTSDSGIWYVFQYKARFPSKWKDDWESGYADPDYWERTQPMQWRLKEGKSASAAIKAWRKGLTIAECRATTMVVYADTVRAFIGDAKFDELYGSTDKETLLSNRLEVGAKGSPQIEQLMRPTESGQTGAEGTMGHRPAKVGEWHYFRNHPMYLLKHPGGVFQGENALLLEDPPAPREQVWSGLGENKKTERAMLEDMRGDFKRARNKADTDRLELIKQRHGGVLPPQYNPGFFPDEVTVDQILTDPPYEYENPFTGEKRMFKGGFRPESGQELDYDKLLEIRNTP